jgi:hypothetical protein
MVGGRLGRVHNVDGKYILIGGTHETRKGITLSNQCWQRPILDIVSSLPAPIQWSNYHTNHQCSWHQNGQCDIWQRQLINAADHSIAKSESTKATRRLINGWEKFPSLPRPLTQGTCITI